MIEESEMAMRSHWSTPVLVNDYLYGCSGRNAPDSDFRCVKFSTGEVQWVDPRRTGRVLHVRVIFIRMKNVAYSKS